MKKLTVLMSLMLMLTMMISSVHADENQERFFQVLDPAKVIEPQLASRSDGIKGTINIVRLLVPSNLIEQSEYEIRIEFTLNSRHEAFVEAEIPERRNSAFASPVHLVKDKNRHVFRVDMLNNGFDGIMDFRIKDLKLPADFDGYNLEISINVEGSNTIKGEKLVFASTSNLYYKIEVGLPVNPGNQSDPLSAGPMVLEQIVPVKLRNITFSLPNGFYWDTNVQNVLVKPLFGFTDTELQEIPVKYNDVHRDGSKAREVELQFNQLEYADEFTKSAFEVQGSYPLEGLMLMHDSGTANTGAVMMKSKFTLPAESMIAHYRNPRVNLYEITEADTVATAENTPLKGFTLEEASGGELRPGDVLSLTLPQGAHWRFTGRDGEATPSGAPQLTIGTEANRLQFDVDNDRINWQFADRNHRTIYTTVRRGSGTAYLREPAKLVFSGSRVVITEDFSGNADIVVAGSAAGRNGLTYTAAIIEPKDLQEEIIVDDPEGTVTEPTEMISFRLPIDSDFYEKDGSLFPYRVAPVIRDSRTFLGLRDVAEMIGVPGEMIQWNPEQENVMILQNGKQIRVEIGNADIQYDGMVERMDTVPFIHEGRTMLPISPLMKVLGIDYTWDAEANTIIFAR